VTLTFILFSLNLNSRLAIEYLMFACGTRLSLFLPFSTPPYNSFVTALPSFWPFGIDYRTFLTHVYLDLFFLSFLDLDLPSVLFLIVLLALLSLSRQSPVFFSAPPTRFATAAIVLFVALLFRSLFFSQLCSE